jgi:TonB family protein
MLDTYLRVNLRKPFMAQVANVKGRITLQAVVETDGKLSDVTVLRGIRPDCDAEALRVFRQFNAWKPALKADKAVRQVITYPVVIKANAPVFYENGEQTLYYNPTEPGKLPDPAQATLMTVSAVDTLTGLPSGDLTVYKVVDGKRGSKIDRFPLVRKEQKSADPTEPPTYMVGHKHATSDWVGLIHILRADGSHASSMPSNPCAGLVTTFAKNGIVASIKENMTGNYTEWYPNGQLKKITESEPDTNTIMRRSGPTKLIHEWDEAGNVLVMNGNGTPTYLTEIASKRDPTRKTRLTTQGSYRDGLQHGLWRAYTADSSYSYEEHYENGLCKGGKTIINGEVTRYKKAEVAPEFKGGIEAMYYFLGSNIQYPADAQRASAMGRVFVSFTVCTDGTLCDFDVLKGVYPSLDDEAIRVIKKMSKRWKPGTLRGEPVRVRYNLPISFQLN